MKHTRALVSKLWIVTSLFLLADLAVAGSEFVMTPSGSIQVSGRIQKTSQKDIFKIGGIEFRFGPGKLVFNTEFDEKSRDAMVGQDLIALLNKKADGYEMTAVIQRGLFSAEETTVAPDDLNHASAILKVDAGNSGLKGRLFSPAAKAYRNYRSTLTSSRAVKPGDSALILTFSGSQGDDFGAAMGHFAFGEATVLPNMELSGEISNFYPVNNEKEIRPGHVDLVDYFGNFISGQTQYRPVFSLILYGVDRKALDSARTEMNKIFHFLYENPEFKISIDNNCTTESCDILTAAGLDPVSTLYGVKHAALPTQSGTLSKLRYLLSEDKAHFLPRDSFDRALQNLMKKGTIGGQSVTRVDFVFQGQVPSARARGGLSPGNLLQYLQILAHFPREVGADLRKGLVGICSRLTKSTSPSLE